MIRIFMSWARNRCRVSTTCWPAVQIACVSAASVLLRCTKGRTAVGRQQSHLMAKLHELAAPLVHTATGFHHDGTRLSIGKPWQHLCALHFESLDVSAS